MHTHNSTHTHRAVPARRMLQFCLSTSVRAEGRQSTFCQCRRKKMEPFPEMCGSQLPKKHTKWCVQKVSRVCLLIALCKSSGVAILGRWGSGLCLWLLFHANIVHLHKHTHDRPCKITHTSLCDCGSWYMWGWSPNRGRVVLRQQLVRTHNGFWRIPTCLYWHLGEHWH